ncbi:MAG: antitoxin Xre/MbcA/ParS toxin-binding domain-containing protein [Thiotrichales bacterium]
MALFDSWGLSPRDILSVLEIDSVAIRHVDKFRNDRSFPDGVEMDERIEHLICIAEALHTAYPLNPQMAKVWLRRSNRKLGNLPPMEHLVSGGMDGLRNVRAELDCTYAWKRFSAEA